MQTFKHEYEIESVNGAQRQHLLFDSLFDVSIAWDYGREREQRCNVAGSDIFSTKPNKTRFSQ